MESFSSLPNPVVNHATLLGMLDQYARPNDKISELIAKQELLPLKRGLYLLAHTQQTSKELIANHLHGPSYVSRHWALAYYGLLTERVSLVTSMCLERSRQVETQQGTFHYQAIPAAYYAMGISSIQQGDIAFMIATPEKALTDLLVSTRHLRLYSQTTMLTYLENDLRLDEEDLKQLDIARLFSFTEQGYKSALLTLLAKTIEGLSHA
ncbi:MAG: hypothetical protein V3U84_03185 [Thiotrichaceae bacterium]